MITSKSPRKVMLAAFHIAKDVLPKYTCKFSRKDFTLPQLFACLVVREHQKQTYRGIEALLRDAPHWCKAIGMKRVPDHNTVCRAFHVIIAEGTSAKMLDLLCRWFAMAQLLGKTLSID